jgi:pimeloyl-ACP methyl ester carboxylesterase
MRMRVSGLFGVLALVGVYGLFCAMLYTGQRDMLYFPTAEVGAAAAQDMRFESGGESLKVWHYPRETDRAVLYFGGNAEDVSRSVATLRTAFPDAALYALNYRGYGGSTGEPGEQAFYADALALFDIAHRDHASVAVVGRSIGSGVATYLASQRDVDRLVLVTPFDSMLNVVRERYWMFPIALLLRDVYDSAARADDIDAPVLMLLAEQDSVVPFERSMELLRAFDRDDIEAFVLRGTDHNSIGGSADYLRLLRDFFAESATPVDLR